MNFKPTSILIIFLVFIISPIQNIVFAQCTGCTVNVGATGNPAISNNDVICINVNRSTPLNLNNRTGLTVCIPDGITMSGALQNIGNPITIDIYGSNSSAFTLGTGSVFNVFGGQIGDITSNNGASINNSGSISGNITLNSTGATYNNAGIHTGSLTMNSGSTVVNFGILDLSGLTSNSGSILSNLSNATLSVSAGININGVLNNDGNISISGNVATNSGSQLNNSGGLTITGTLTNNSQVNSALGIISIGGNLTNNGGSVLNIGTGSVGGNAINNGTINISGELSIDGNLTMNGGSNISAANADQPNYLSVGATFSGAGCLNGTNGVLFINKFQSGGSCINDEVYIGGNPGCMELIEIPYQSGGEDLLERIYIFRCSTDWTIPDSSIPGETLLDAEVLIVGGGGGGGRGASAGGGGAGGLLYFSTFTLSPGFTIPVMVGSGGLGSTSASSPGANGGNSGFVSNVAIGGGGGGSSSAGSRNGNAGGSGGGGAFVTGNPNGTAGSGTQGNDGGRGNNTPQGGGRRFGGGGGGADANGGLGPDGSSQAGARGGNGRSFDISGSTAIYAAGGGGTASGPGVSQGIGGSSGVGGSANAIGASRNGQANTGSGGGATSSGSGGNGADGIIIVKQSFRILPVDILYFKAGLINSNREISLNWATSKEWDNSHFEIERSTGNAHNWQNIGQVEGIGWSDTPKDYEFLDINIPKSGALIYYRLRQMDFNGSFSYSKIISVKNIPVYTKSGVSWSVYPNPVKGERLTLESLDSTFNQDEEVFITLMNFSGSSFVTFAGDINSISDLLSEEIQNSKPGVYILKISTGKKTEYLKIAK